MLRWIARITVTLAALMFIIGATSPSHLHASTLVELLQEQTHTHPADQHGGAVVADVETGQHHNPSDHTHDTAVRLGEFPDAAGQALPHTWEQQRAATPLAAFVPGINRPPCPSLTA